jgi:hypothetical protein
VLRVDHEDGPARLAELVLSPELVADLPALAALLSVVDQDHVDAIGVSARLPVILVDSEHDSHGEPPLTRNWISTAKSVYNRRPGVGNERRIAVPFGT